MKRRAAAYFLILALLLTLLAGCASKSYDSAATEEGYYYTDNDYKNESSYDMIVEDSAEAEAPSSLSTDALVQTGNITDGRKIILNAELYLETKTFDESAARLQEIITDLGGYVSRADVYVRNATYSLHSANYTVRIPSENFDRFIAYREDIGTVTSTNVWTDDVTDSYYDKEARLQSLETKQQRLLELLEKAEDMDAIIALESELSDTIYEIELLTGSLRKLDNQIAYSTIHIYLEEVREVTEPVAMPKTLGERMAQQFRRSMENLGEFCEDFLVWFVGALPVLVILVVIIALTLLVFRATASRRAVRRVRRAEKKAEALKKWNETRAKLTEKAGEKEDK